MIHLLDSSILIDVLNGRRRRGEFLAQLSQRDILFACCSINVTEVYMGMRRGEEAKTQQLLQSLEFFPVTWEIAKHAGELFREWRRKGHTLALSDVTIAAVAITHGLTLVTDNQKHFPTSDLELFSLPDSE
jgi:predicted nucleic acid-binding protein